MKNAWIKMLCLVMALLMLAGMVGCGPEGDTDQGGTTTADGGTTTTTQGGSEEVLGFYDADGNFYPYFDEDGDYVWDGFKDADDNSFYFFDENEDGTPDGYSDSEGNRYYYDGSGGEGSEGGNDNPIVPVATTTTKKDTVTTTTKNGEVTTTTTQQTKPSKELYAAVRGTTVKVLYASEPEATTKKQIKAFELAYGCTVEPVVVAWNEFKNSFLAMVTSGDVPDVVGTPDETFLKWVSRGLLQPMDAYVNASDPVWSSAIWDAFSWKGKHYGAGGDSGVVPMFTIYNASMFKAKGVKTPKEYYEEGNWNFDTLKKAAIEMTYGDVTGVSIGWRYLPHLCNGHTAVNLDRDNGVITNGLGDSNAITATELMAELLRGKYATNEAPFEKFGNSQIAMILERPWNNIGQFDVRNTTLKNAEIEIVPLPVGPDGSDTYMPSILNANSIPERASNPLGGAAWIYFGITYGEAHANDADVVAERRKTYTDEQYQFVQEYASTRKPINTFVYGVGNWYSDDWGYWASIILDGLSVQAANDKFKGEFQTMIDETVGNV